MKSFAEGPLEDVGATEMCPNCEFYQQMKNKFSYEERVFYESAVVSSLVLFFPQPQPM